MDRSNNKPLIPGFAGSSFTTQFPGLQNSSANAFMSTLQNLQMQSLGLDIAQWSQATPAQQQAWLDQAKVAAMLPMYAIVKQSEQAANALTGSLLDKNGLAFNMGQNTIFPNSSQLLASVANDNKLLEQQLQHLSHQESHQSTSTPNDIDVGTNSQPITQPHSQAGSSRDSPQINVTNHTPDPKVPQTSDAPRSIERWNQPEGLDLSAPMKNYVPEASTSKLQSSLAHPRGTKTDGLFVNLKEKRNGELNPQMLATALAANTLLSPRAPDGRLISPKTLNQSPVAPRSSPVRKNLGVSPRQKTNSASGKQAQDDALDTLFTMVDQGGVEDPLFTEDEPNHGGLSPIQFTPPDSPTFGCSTDKKKNTNKKSVEGQASTSAFTAIPQKKQNGSTSLFAVPKTQPPAPAPTPANLAVEPLSIGVNTPPPRAMTSSMTPTFKFGGVTPKKKESLFRSIAKSSKVPVYKQNKTTAVLEEDKTKPKKEKDIDAFEFDDEEDLFADVEQKDKVVVAELNISSEVKKQNVYVPGIGYAISAESTTKTVPKKRPADRSGALPYEVPYTTTTTSHSEIVTLAESIRRRRNGRLACEFLKPESGQNSECAKQIGESTMTVPRLPKIIIRRKVAPVVEGDKRKRKRTKGADSEDDDWPGPRKAGRPKTKHLPKPPVEYEAILIERDKTDYDVVYYREDLSVPDGNIKLQNRNEEARKARRILMETAKNRLSKFGPAEGILPKGTYVVCKADLTKDDCALWRVDNQNLLQKFMPKEDPNTRTYHYKSSSTYSGWCEQISPQYYRVSIKVIKHSRSETVIQPEIPLSDLFPAMAIECHDQCEVILKQASNESCRTDENDIQRDSLKSAINSYLQALIYHALTLEHMQSLFQKNDWTFLRSLVEIDKHNKDSEEKITAQVRVPAGIMSCLRTYVNLALCDYEMATAIDCQVCNSKRVKKIVQLHSREFYDPSSLLPREEFPMLEKDSDTESDQEDVRKARDELEKLIRKKRRKEGAPLPAMELYACSRCSKALFYLHWMHHTRFHLFMRCETKLELIGTQHPEFAPERVVEVAKKDRAWFISVINEYADVHKKISAEF